MNSTNDFYQPVATDYDQVFEFEQRFRSAHRFVAGLMDRIGSVAAASDTACGTGVYGLALAEVGVAVVGTDLSPAMIERARVNGERLGLAVDWRVQPLQKPICGFRGDLILCMGNSIPHLLNEDELKQALESFLQSLQPGGVLVLNLLNYQRVLQRRERMIGVTRGRDGREFIRFYDFFEGEPNVVFNLLTLDWNGAGTQTSPTTEWHSTRLHPYTESELNQALREVGFGGLQSFGGLDFSPYRPEESDALLIIARAGEAD